jgi:DNA-binding NarL/FixJ family response regulator
MRANPPGDGGRLSIVVVDDHPVFRLGMSALLSSIDGFEVVAEAATAEAGIAAVDAHNVDVVVMDLHLGGMSGVEATRQIVARHPGVGVLVVTMLDDDDSVFASIRAGARGYLLKGANPHDIARAIRSVASGEVLLGPEVANRAMAFLTGARRATPAPFADLTARELEVLELVAEGLDNLSIAHRVGVSPKTVRNHLSNILTKLQVPDRAQAIVRAREAGLGVDPSRPER